jgi:hypothetical protein
MKDLKIKTSFVQTFSTTNGVVDEDRLNFAKQTLIFDTFRDKTNIVNYRSDYPGNTSTSIEFKIDVVLVDAYRYKQLLQLESTLLSEL